MTTRRSAGRETLLGADSDCYRSLRKKAISRAERFLLGRRLRQQVPRRSLGTLTFPLVLQHVADMTTVEDPPLLAAMFYLWERLKLVVEPTGALGAAAVLGAGDAIRGARVGVILSGGTVDLSLLPEFLARR